MPPKKTKKAKKVDETIDLVMINNRIDAMNELFMNTLNKLTELDQKIQNVSLNHTFHTHDTMLRTGPATFNQAMYNQWTSEQKAKADAAKAEEERGKPKA